MEIFYSHYTITPMKRINRTSSMDRKHGVYLMARVGGFTTFADYFPHMAFGDRGVDQFLAEFKFQKHEYDRKILHFLHHDRTYHSIPQVKYFNHQLWSGSEEIEAPVLKYKLLRHSDDTFMDPLKRGVRVRLDANGLFNREGFRRFLESIPKEYHPQIEYIEDPILDKNWHDLGVKAAQDLIQGSPYFAKIYRPNSCFFPENEPNVIFSSYLGSELGRWHTYCELIEKGNLNLIHGIISKGYYAEDKFFLKGSYEAGFCADPASVMEMYQELAGREWKPLTSL